MRDAMIAGVTLNIFNNHADRVRMANLAQSINVLQAVILTNKEKIILTPTFHVMEMYNVHQDAALIPLKIESPKYINGKDSLDAVSVSASVDKNGITHVSLVNIDPAKTNTVSIDLGKAAYNQVSGRILVSARIQDFNSFEDPAKIKPAIYSSATLKSGKLSVPLPPGSVVVLTLK